MKTNTKYIQMMEEVLLWLQGLWTRCLFMQDGTTLHTRELTQKWCQDNVHDFLHKLKWLAKLDMNPMDFSISS